MKKILLFVASFCSLASFAQSFDKNKIYCGLNYDLGVYATKIYDRRLDTTDNDGAGSHIFSLWGEYGVLPWLGVGARVAGVSYLTQTDSATNVKPSSSSFDFGVMVNAHLIRKEKFDLPLGVFFGGSTWNWKNNYTDNGMIKDFGTVFNVNLNPRFYFGAEKRFGFNLKLAYAIYSYKSLDLSTNTTSETNIATLTGKGMNIGLGFQMRL